MGSTNSQAAPYAARREKLFQALPNNTVLLVPAQKKLIRNGDAHYPYRQDSDFYYLSGFLEDNALLVFLKKDNETAFIVFCQENNAIEARWQGPRLGVQKAKEVLGANQAYAFSALKTQLLLIISDDIQALYYPKQRTALEIELELGLELEKGALDFKKIEWRDAGLIIHPLRLIKDDYEINLMQKAVDISVQAHIRAMKACKPGLMEYELEAEYIYEFTRLAAKSPAYTSIVGAGGNACILHYIDNQAIIREGDLVLVDAGAEYQGYAADITRVFPANGRFSTEQKIIYELVLKAQIAAIALARVGEPFDAMQAVIIEIFVTELMNLDIISDPKDYVKYYMHRSGHWLGLDVHDVGAYQIEGKTRLLEAGMVLTVEPGLYFSSDCLDIDPKWRGIGVRIEDDILVTEHGPRVLSAHLPKTVEAIEALMEAR